MKNNLYNLKKKLIRSTERKFKYVNILRPAVYPENKFVIYTRGRTGSSVLTELLNCHPEIFCDVEIFNYMYCHSRVFFPDLYIRSCSKRAAIHHKTVYGFKVKIAQLRFEHKYNNYENILKKLSDEGWKFIYLKRENYLRHKLSNIFTTQTNIFRIKNRQEINHKKIRVDCEQLLRGITYSEEVSRTEEENLKNIPHIKITYEGDLLDNSKHQETADKIFGYLNLSTHKVFTDLKRMSSENLEDMLENYDEVYDFFKDTKYKLFLK